VAITVSLQATFDSEGSWGNRVEFDVTDTKVTSETITSTGSINYVNLQNTGGKVTVLSLNGNAFLQTNINSAFATQLNSINASADTGGFIFNMANTGAGTLKSGFTFTGGSGVDGLAINKASLDALTSGSQLNGGTGTSGNMLAIRDLGTLTAGEGTKLSATKGFQILGVLGTTGNLSGDTIIINDAYLTNAFGSHLIDAQDGGSLTVTNVKSTYTLDIINGNYGYTPAATDFNIGSAASTNTALTVNITPNYTSLSSPTTPYAGLTLKSLTTTVGTVRSVALVSNTATSANIINTYHGSENQTLTITGNDALTIGSVTQNTTTGDTINASGFTQALTLGTTGTSYTAATLAGDTGKGDVIKLGSGASYLAVSSFTKGDQITLLSSHTASDTIDTTLIASHLKNVGTYTNAGAQQTDITQITNFHSNSDILKVGIAGGSTAPHIGNTGDLSGTGWSVTGGFATKSGSTLTAFLSSVASSTTFAANDVLAYKDGTNTYIVVGDHTTGTALGEHIIELVGVSTATALGAAGSSTTIHLS